MRVSFPTPNPCSTEGSDDQLMGGDVPSGSSLRPSSSELRPSSRGRTEEFFLLRGRKKCIKFVKEVEGVLKKLEGQ